MSHEEPAHRPDPDPGAAASPRGGDEGGADATEEHINRILSTVHRQLDNLRAIELEEQLQGDAFAEREAIVGKEEDRVRVLRQALLVERERLEAVQRELVALAARQEESRRSGTEGTGAPNAEVERLTEYCNRLRRALAETRERADHTANAGIELAQEVEHERDRALAELDAARQELSRTTSRLDETTADARALRDRVAELEKADAARSGAPAGADEVGASMRIGAMQQRIYRLEKQLEEAQASASAPASEPAPEVADLRSKAERIATVAMHLRQRQIRLRRMRRLLRERKAAGRPPKQRGDRELIEQHAARMRELEGARHDVAERRALLAETEKRMIRRWACARASATAGWVALVALVAAGLSWAAVTLLVPPVRAASVTLEAKAKNRATVKDDEAARWQAWHLELMDDDGFRRTLAARMDERKLDRFALVPAVAEALDDDVTVDTTDPTSLVLTMAGTRPREMTAFLDILASTLATESVRQARKQADRAWSVVANERKDDGIVSYAVVNPASVRDTRLYWLGPAFVLVFAGLLGVGGVTYRRLMRVKREFDSDGSLFRDPAPVRAAA